MNTSRYAATLFSVFCVVWIVVISSVGGAQGTRVERSPVAPDDEAVQRVMNAAHEMFANDREGENATYIPELARVPSELFGIAVASVDGIVLDVGDADYEFSIQSIGKVFTLAMVMDQEGPEVVLDRLGAEATGLPFNSLMAIELQPTRVGNPLVNAGAIATASLVAGSNPDQKWENILRGYSQFAGAELRLMQDVYESEAATNSRNQAIARLLQNYERMYDDPETSVDVYTKQSSVGVTATNLAVMGATLAAGGVNPLTGDRVIRADIVPEVLSLMLTAGMYDSSGTWSFTTGLPAKSGVGGGIIAVVPGKGAVAAFSPRLDEAGNSVRAQRAIGFVAEELSINIFSPQSVGVSSDR